jgi:hypothetical protein
MRRSRNGGLERSVEAAALLKHPLLEKYADQGINIATLLPELSPSG